MRISYEPHERVKLSHVEGAVEPYKGYRLPDVLAEPVRANITGDILGYSSGYRSALLKADGVWFKCKGIKPTPLPFLGHPVPYGSLTLERSVNELESNAKLDEKLREYGYSNGPLRPAGRIDYEVPFEDGKCHGAMLRCFGDSRLLSMFESIEGKMNEGRKLPCSGSEFENLLSGMCSWAGFMQKALQESSLLYPKGNNDCQNYVFFSMDGGCGFGLVDHDDTKENTDAALMKESRDRTKEQLTYHILELSESLGIVPGLESTARYETLKDRLSVSYYDGLDGKTMPTPISAQLMRKLFE